MSRLVMFFGILLLIIGGAGVVFGFIGVPLQFTNTITQAITPTAAELCNPGETLDEEGGASQYTPGQGYARSVRYFCVNDAGVRREVTGSFVTGMLGDVFNGLGVMLIPALASCVLTVGIFFTVIGVLLSRRKQMRAANNFAFPDEQQIFITRSQPARAATGFASSASRNEFAAKLRQIEEAHKSGLISEEEYQRLRQEALDEMI